MAGKAHAADKDSVEANLMLSAIYARGYWDWKKAEGFTRRAIELNPGNAEVWNEYGFLILAPTGRLEEALVAQRRAVALDPLNMRMAQSLSDILMYLNRCDEAMQQARTNLELDPRLRFQHITIARCHEMKRDYVGAIAAWRNVGQPWIPKNFLDELQALMESPSGRADPAATYWRARLAWNIKYEEGTYGRTYHTATFAAQAGETDEAFRYLNRAIDRRELMVFMLKVDQQFDSLRKDPRFAEALARVNLQ